MAKKNNAIAKTNGIDEGNASLRKMSANQAADLIRSRGYSVSRDVSLQEGDVLEGSFMGAGAVVELPSKNTPGKIDLVATWRVRSIDGAIEFRVMGSAGLDKHLSPLAPETPVLIAHLGTIETKKGNRMNDFAVAVGKVAQ